VIGSRSMGLAIRGIGLLPLETRHGQEDYLYIFSILIIVISNVIYNICTKSTPNKINPFASLIVTYLTAAFLAAIAGPFYTSEKGFTQSFGLLNWTSLTLGIAIVGLEFGYIMAYRAGWNISVGSLVANILLALILVPVGIILFKEGFCLNKTIGAALCIAGLVMLNKP
jgi:uncharacterized membrane protein